METNYDTLQSFNKALEMFGVTTEQATCAAEKFSSIAANISDPDVEISLIRSNPSLNFVQKARLIRMIRNNNK